MKKIIYLLCFFSFLSTLAQTETIETPKVATGSYITFNLLAPIALETPRYRFGYIIPLGGKWMVGMDAGYGDKSTTISILDRIDREDYRLYEFRAEVYYQLPIARKNIHYLSLELGYLNHREVFKYDYYNKDIGNIRVSYDSANYERNRSALTLKYGTFFDLWDQVGINIYYGMGVRRRNNSFTNLVNASSEESDNDDLFSSNNDRDEWNFGEGYFREEGTRYGFNFQLGFKLYYNFK